MVDGNREIKTYHMDDMLLYKIALTLIPGIGDLHGKKLVAYCGGVEAVFREKKPALLKIPGVGKALAEGILSKQYLRQAEKEADYIRNNQIRPLFYLDKEYPVRLRHCEDGPMMLYFRGSVLPGKPQVLAVVGTRRPTSYGMEVTTQVITELRDLDLLIVSGLAYGIDTCAHRAALAANLPTVAVLAHGLDNLYPYLNKPLADKMVAQGGLLTEFPSGTRLNKDYFPRRNRVIAGLSDAVLVIESAGKGGALITADIAQSYNRDVFAIPGRVNDPKSVGCNRLIRNNKAALVENAADIRYLMGWDRSPQHPVVQPRLFTELSPEEQRVLETLPDSGEADIDDIYLKSGFTASKVAAILLKLEFDGLIACLPGKRYRKSR